LSAPDEHSSLGELTQTQLPKIGECIGNYYHTAEAIIESN